MNLLSKLHKNSILTGPVESYCLACGYLLHSEEESYAHIHEPGHVDKLDAVQRPESYKDDCILKIKEGYFCPYCNIVLPTIKRVSLHISEPLHRNNKNEQSIIRHAGVIFAFDVAIIDDRSWHGEDGSTCFVCNEDYDDEDSHRRRATHVLNLIQIKCEFGETYVYRMVDEDLFFCLLCSDIRPISEKLSHHESEQHLNLYLKSKNEGIAIRNKKPATIERTDNNVPSVVEPNNTPTLSTSLDKPIRTTEASKDECNCKAKIQEDKTQNGSPNVEDSEPTTQKNTDSSQLNTDSINETAKLNTQKTQKLITEKTPVVKLDTPNKNTQETLKLNTAKDSQDIKLDSQNKNTQDTSNSEKVQTSQELKGKPVALNATKVSKLENTEALIAKVETEKSEPKTTNKSKSDFYEFLKKHNFVTHGHDVLAFCSLCDCVINEADIFSHKFEKHHVILHAKHTTRENAQLSKNLKTVNGQDGNKTDNEPSETTEGLKPKESKASTVTGEGNAVPVIATAKDNTQVKPAPSKTKGKVATKDAKGAVTDKITAPVTDQANKAQINVQPSQNNTKVSNLNKENTAPDNKELNVKITTPVTDQANTAQINVQPSENNTKVSKLNKENTAPDNKELNVKITAPVTDQANTTQINVQPSENKPKVSKLNKENTAPDNKAQNVNTASIRNSSNKINKGDMKPEPAESTIQPKKLSKKAQKKALKAKNVETEVALQRESNESGTPVPEASGTGEVTAEEQSHTEALKKLAEDSRKDTATAQVEDSKKKVQINYEVSRKDSVKVNGETSSQLATDADLKTEKLLNLLKTVSQVDSGLDDVVINSKYVLGNLSFVLVVRTGSKAQCVACKKELTLDDIHTHIATEGHGSNVEDCLVVTSLDDEFIRQLKTQEYHCGYCNIVLPNWNDMKTHLASYRHSDSKTSASWRLERYHPHLKHCETREVRSVLSTIFRCTRV